MNTLRTFFGEQEPVDLENEVVNRIAKKEDYKEINYTAYIPSKGRSDNCVTAKTFLTHGFSNFKIVVEPQEYELYKKEFLVNNLLQLDANDQGIAYARSFIKKYSQSINETFHWQLDDDISQFKMRIENKNVKVTPYESMGIVEEISDMFGNIGMCGITHAAYAFAKKTHIGLNKFAYCVVLINNSTEHFWNKGVLDDLDYALQTLELGYVTLTFNSIIFDAPSTGTVKGGNMLNMFKDDNRKKIYENTIKKWPGRFKLKELNNKKKGWTLKHIRRFYNDYTQEPTLKT